MYLYVCLFFCLSCPCFPLNFKHSESIHWHAVVPLNRHVHVLLGMQSSNCAATKPPSPDILVQVVTETLLQPRYQQDRSASHSTLIGNLLPEVRNISVTLGLPMSTLDHAFNIWRRIRHVRIENEIVCKIIHSWSQKILETRNGAKQ